MTDPTTISDLDPGHSESGIDRVRRQALRLARALWRQISVLVIFFLALVIIFQQSRGGGEPPAAGARAAVPDHQEAAEQIWTCSMHPQIRQHEPGLCPICNMDLVLVKGSQAEGERVLSLTPAAAALARVETSPVVSAIPHTRLRLTGMVSWDETRLVSVTAWFPGRVDKLAADFTGMELSARDPVAEIYSPMLHAAWEELVVAGSPPADQGLLDAARDKLRLLGISEEQLLQVEQSGDAPYTGVIPAGTGGTVKRRLVSQGAYVKEGEPLLELGDLSRVWVNLDAYEADLPWLMVGQTVALELESGSRAELSGRISFIDPLVDPVTRTAGVRVEVENPERVLKPGMFVRGYVDAEQGEARVLVPETALLRTGTRAVVYVELPDREEPTFEGREVILGPRAGSDRVVLSGLEPGERVVSRAAFRIDSALQIQAKPSMMAMPSDTVRPRGPALRDRLGPVYSAYFQIWNGLQGDDPELAAGGWGKLQDGVAGVDTSGLTQAEVQLWSELSAQVLAAAKVGRGKLSAAEQRIPFEPLSLAMLSLDVAAGHPGELPHFRMFCPMAFDNRGAEWLQEQSDLLNPYFGAMMLRCGTRKETLPALPGHPGPSTGSQAPVSHSH